MTRAGLLRAATRAALLGWGLISAALLAQDTGPPKLHEFAVPFPYPIVGRDSLPSAAEMARMLAEKKTAPVLIFMISDRDADYYAPKFSADGKSLAYLKADIKLHTSKIVLLEDVARPQRKILFDGLDCYDYMFAWSHPSAGCCVFSSTGKRDELNLYLGRANAEPKQITSGASLKKHGDLFLSGDTIRLLYEDGTAVKLIEMKSTDPPSAQAGRDVDFGGYPAWAPDGRSFAFAKQRGEAGGRPAYDLSVRRMDAGKETGAPRTIFPSKGMTVRNPVWDPSGGQIAFYVGEMKKTWDLYLVKVGAQSPARTLARDVVANEIFTSVDAAWDPAGRGLFYFANTHESAGYYPLCHVDAASGEETVIDYDKSLCVAMDVAVRADREGPELAFAAMREMSRSIYIMMLNHF